MATFIMTRLTFLEALRRKIALAAFVLGLAFLLLYGVGFYFIQKEARLSGADSTLSNLARAQAYNFLTSAGLYAVNFLSLAMGALVSADTLAGEISSGTVQTLATKPVPRAEIVLGKWLGFAGLLAIYMTLMAGGVLVLVYAIAGYQVPNPLAGLGIMYLESVLVMTLTLACSSTLSTLATGGTVFGLYGVAFIGGWVEQLGSLLRNQTAVNIGILSSLIMPSEALFRRAAYEMTSPAARALGFSVGPSFVASVPSALMLIYGAVYIAAALGVAMQRFGQRDL